MGLFVLLLSAAAAFTSMVLFSFVLEGMVLYFTFRCNTDTPSLESRLGALLVLTTNPWVLSKISRCPSFIRRDSRYVNVLANSSAPANVVIVAEPIETPHAADVAVVWRSGRSHSRVGWLLTCRSTATCSRNFNWNEENMSVIIIRLHLSNYTQ